MGRRCRVATIKDVAQETRLDWKTVKALDMQEQLRRAGTPAPAVIGVDEISIRKGHTYRIVVSDLLRRRPIWFGGTDRSEASMDAFVQWLGPKKSRKIRQLCSREVPSTLNSRLSRARGTRRRMRGFEADGAEAMQWARRDIELRDNFGTQAALAWALHREPRVTEARDLMQKALSSGASDARLYARAAVIYRAAGDDDKADSYSRVAAEIDPHHAAFHVHR